MSRVKLRRIDFWFDDWIAGTIGMSDADRGVYIQVLAGIYSHGGPIHIDHARALCGRQFNRSIERLIRRSKLTLTAQYLDSNRAAIELQRSTNRALTAQHNGAKGGRPNRLANPAVVATEKLPSILQHTTPTSKKDSEAIEASAATSAAKALSQVDSIKEFWANSVGYLAAAGIVEKQARALIGKWRSEYGQTAVMGAIAASIAEAATEPIAFISARLKKSPMANRPNGKLTAASERFIATYNAAMETARRIEREREAYAIDPDDDFP